MYLYSVQVFSNFFLKSNHVSNVSAEYFFFKLYLRDSKTINLGLGQLGHLGQILDKHFLKIILFTKKISYIHNIVLLKVGPFF